MNEFEVVHIIWLAGVLILAGSALAAHRLSWKRGFVMALGWAGIFAVVTLFIDLVRRAGCLARIQWDTAQISHITLYIIYIIIL